ncbi:MULTISPECIES: DUF5694 domain-containing protein [Halorussus]|uniref:DUF5694 domain-containing protein n=1 Tax=Halorussus TaxID=1070314 RepID=UPI0020A08159|nr:DUF5694 domain-containing protein [Halorussus vallis]USZ76278.1 DUF5694 domain-containing protein [Halorussus vallis]
MSGESDAVADVRPDHEVEEVQVMLLGTYHMANPGNDEVNVDADDVLAAERQAELEELAGRLVAFNPDRIAVEWPYDWQEGVTELYEEYRSGSRAYADEESIDAERLFGADADLDCRNEVVQVGFRLADRLDHDRPIAVDEHPEEPDADPFEDREVDSTRKTSVELPDPESMQRETEERLASSTMPEYLAWVNGEANLRENHDLMFDRAIRATDDQFGSPIALAHWYDRNLRMVHHLWRAIEPGDERALLLVGSGHVRALRHLLTEAPMFCPVSPLPHLE